MPWRSGSPQGVFSAAATGAVPEAAGPWACVRTTDNEMMPTAAPATAKVIIGPENVSRMMVSLSVSGCAIRLRLGGDCSIFRHRPTAAFAESGALVHGNWGLWSQQRSAFGAWALPAGAW